MIEHQENGYLAKPFEVEDLARGINWVLEDTERYNQLCIRARQKVEQQFTLELQAEKYLELYGDILSQSNGYPSFVTLGKGKTEMAGKNGF